MKARAQAELCNVDDRRKRFFAANSPAPLETAAIGK